MMQLKMTFKNLEHSPALDEKIREKTAKFENYVHGRSAFHWMCWKDSLEKYHVEIKAVGPHLEFFAKCEHDNFYKCIDLVVDKMERQFEKHKSKKENRIHNHDPVDHYEAS